MNYERRPKETCHALRETLIAIEADFHDNWIKDTAHVKPIDRSYSFDSRETKQTLIYVIRFRME